MSSPQPISESAPPTPPQEDRVARLLETFYLHAYDALRAGVPCPRPRGHVATGDEHGHEDAAMPPGQHAPEIARAWLEKQGFDISGGDGPAIGLFTVPEAVRQQLLASGFSAEEIDASALADDPRLAGRVVGPIRDRFGRILSFWARHPDDQPPRYLFKGKWKDETGLFGLDVALGARVRDSACPPSLVPPPLIVVQQLLDAIFLQSKGLTAVAAIGGSPRDLSKRRWQRLSALDVRRVILAFDRADDGCRETLIALDSAFAARSESDAWPDIEVFVLPVKSLRGFVSLAELVRAEGAALEGILDTEPVHAYGFVAAAILDRHRPGPEEGGRAWTDATRHAAWKEAIEFYTRQGPRAVADLDRHFVPVIVAGLGRCWDTFEPLGGVDSAPGEHTGGMVGGGRGAAGKRRPAARSSGTCSIHGCDMMTCFCFD